MLTLFIYNAKVVTKKSNKNRDLMVVRNLNKSRQKEQRVRKKNQSEKFRTRYCLWPISKERIKIKIHSPRIPKKKDESNTSLSILTAAQTFRQISFLCLQSFFIKKVQKKCFFLLYFFLHGPLLFFFVQVASFISFSFEQLQTSSNILLK